MFKIKYIILLLVVLITIQKSGFSQDSLYFKTLNSRFVIKPNAVLQSYKLQITGKDYHLSYKPDNSLNLGVYFGYKRIGIGIGYNILNQEENLLEEKTVFYDIRFDYLARHLMLKVYYDYYKGFSVDQLSEEFAESDKIDKAQPNLKLNSIGINALIAFSKKYSFKAINNTDEIQKKSAGTFILGVSQFYTSLVSKKSIVPDDIALKYNVPIQSDYGRFLTALPVVGYSYTFVKKSYYISALLAVGAGFQWQKYKVNNIPKEAFNISYKYYNTIKVGYSTSQWFYGISFSTDNNFARIDKANINFRYNQLSFFVGYRWQ